MKLTKNSNYLLTLDDGTELEVSIEDAYMIWRELDADFCLPKSTYPYYWPSTITNDLEITWKA